MDQQSERLTVLVVDDDPSVRMVLDTCLGLSFDVILAEDGHLAKVMVDSTITFDIAIVDVMMPGIDGFQVAAHIRDVRPTTPVIMLSARTDHEARDRALDAGARTFLSKPFDPVVLEATIERFCAMDAPPLRRAQTVAAIVPVLPMRPLPVAVRTAGPAGLMSRR